jgi:N utilization substance protein A
MSTVNLIESFGEFKDLKNIDRVTMMGILEDVFRGVVKRKFGEEAKLDIIINPDKGDSGDLAQPRSSWRTASVRTTTWRSS